MNLFIFFSQKREGEIIAFLNKLIRISFGANKDKSYRFIPKPTNTSSTGSHGIKTIFVTGCHQHPLFANGFKKILRKLFYFYLFHCYFYLCFPHREVRQAMLFMKIIIQSLLLSFQLHNLSKCRNNHIDLPFFCLSSKYLRRIMKWLV